MHRMAISAAVFLILPVLVFAQGEFIDQWALDSVAQSTRTVSSSGAPDQAGGEPNESACELSDDESFRLLSWRPREDDAGIEWIELLFATPVHASAVEVHEALNPGTVTRVSVRNLEGKLLEVWAGEDTNRTCPAVLRVEFEELSFPTNRVRIELNTSLVPGPNTIDAVKLGGRSIAGFEPEFLSVERIFGESPGPARFSTLTDYDNDGWPDLIGWLPPIPFPAGQLQHNEGDGTFGNRSAILPIPTLEKERFLAPGFGVVGGDYDNDGDTDYYWPGARLPEGSPPVGGTDLLLRNDRGNFVDVAADAGLTDEKESVGAIWLDFDLDGLLDLYVNHISFTGQQALPNSLYRNLGGTFVEVTQASGLPLEGSGGGAIVADFNQDGWSDFFIPSGSETVRLFMNDEGRYRGITLESSRFGAETKGGAAGDIDNDGDVDLFVPSNRPEEDQPIRSSLWLNLGDESFLDVTPSAGLQSLIGANPFHARFFDYDNDGDLDLLPGNQFPSLFVNDGQGRFTELTFQAGVPGVEALADFDGDGYLDIWYEGKLFRNQRSENHFLRIDLVGTDSNRDGVGARVYATTGSLRQMRDLSNADGQFQDEMVVHFGTGAIDQVDELEIRWPSGTIDIIRNIPVDQEIRVIEGRGEWYPAPRTVWDVPPPKTANFGELLSLRVVARPALFEPSATITSITGDLSSLGGPDDVALIDQGDGTYLLEAAFVVAQLGQIRDIEILIDQSTSLGPYWINLSRNVDVIGEPVTAVLESHDPVLPESFALAQNYPNPFNPQTTIRFDLPSSADVDLSLYNLGGQRVATLASGLREAGSYSLVWDGRDDAGRQLASGMYFYRLAAGKQVETRKLMLLR